MVMNPQVVAERREEEALKKHMDWKAKHNLTLTFNERKALRLWARACQMSSNCRKCKYFEECNSALAKLGFDRVV